MKTKLQLNPGLDETLEQLTKQWLRVYGTGREAGEVSLHKLRLMEALEENPEIKQVDLAARLRVAVGTVNWLLKRLAAKGYVKVKRIGQ